MISQIFGDLACEVGAACNLCPDQPLPEIQWFVQLDGEIEDKGVEALGRYDPDQQIIEIDAEKCSLIAAKLGQSSHAITGVVLLHELSHWVHHTGRCIHNNMWKDFAAVYASSPQLIEEMAQENTFFSIVLFQPDFLEAMTELSNRSPAPYRIWKSHLVLTGERDKLHLARSKFAFNLWKRSNRMPVREEDILNQPIDE